MSETDLVDAVKTAIYGLEKNGFDVNRAVGYAHPRDLAVSWEQRPYEYAGTQDEICGVKVEKAPHIARGVFVLAHLDAMRHGPKAIQTISFEVDNE